MVLPAQSADRQTDAVWAGRRGLKEEGSEFLRVREAWQLQTPFCRKGWRHGAEPAGNLMVSFLHLSLLTGIQRRESLCKETSPLHTHMHTHPWSAGRQTL